MDSHQRDAWVQHSTAVKTTIATRSKWVSAKTQHATPRFFAKGFKLVTLLQLFFCLDSCKKIFTLTQLNGTWPEPNQNIRYRDESSCVVHSQFNYHQRRITTGEYSIRDKVGEESQKLLCQIIKPSDFEDSSCQPVLYFSRHSIIKLSLKLQCLLFWPLKGDGTNWKHWHIIT